MKLIEREVMRGGWPPMLLQGVVRKVGRGVQVEAWRAFDISGGCRQPIRWMFNESRESQCVAWLTEAAV